MYKDREKQLQASKEAMKRHREKLRVVPENVIPDPVIPKGTPPVIPDGLMGDTGLFRSLPVDIQRGVLGVLKARKELGLHDDSVERIDAAVKYQEFLAGPYQEYQKIAREYLEEAKRKAALSGKS